MRKYFCLIGFLLFVPVFSASAPAREPGFDGTAPLNERQRLITSAESLLGTPYRYAGLDRRGLDCSGLVYLSFLEGLGRIIPRRTEDIYNWAEIITAGELQPEIWFFFVLLEPGFLM